MPLILIAEVVATNPKSDPFPTNGRPRCKINVRVEGSDAALYRIVAFDEHSNTTGRARRQLFSGDDAVVEGAMYRRRRHTECHSRLPDRHQFAIDRIVRRLEARDFPMTPAFSTGKAARAPMAIASTPTMSAIYVGDLGQALVARVLARPFVCLP